MDEIEYHKMYNEVVSLIQKEGGLSERSAMMILQLLNYQHEVIIEIQDSMEC